MGLFIAEFMRVGTRLSSNHLLHLLPQRMFSVVSLVSLTKQGLNLREGRRRDRSQVICADIHQHSQRCWRRQQPTPTPPQHSALQTGGGRDGTRREAEAKRVPLQECEDGLTTPHTHTPSMQEKCVFHLPGVFTTSTGTDIIGIQV